MVLASNTYGVNVYDFHSWLHQRDRERREHLPAADKVMPLIAQAGHAGMTRSEVGKSIGDDLDRDALTALLDALVRAGMVTVSRQNGFEVFRSRVGAAG